MNNYSELKEEAISKLLERGVTLDDMAVLVVESQNKYTPNLSIDYAKEILLEVLSKKEVIYAVLTGIAIDIAVENKQFSDSINNIIIEDKPLYGLDEILALSIVNVFGSIALTNFGYLDKVKPGIIGVVDALGKKEGKCNTFLDDIIGALVAATISRIAHK